MRNLAEGPDRGGANAQGWAVVSDQMGKARLDLVVTRAQSIVVGVGDLGLVIAIIELVVMSDIGGESGELGRRIGFVELGDRLRLKLSAFRALELVVGLGLAHRRDHAERFISLVAAARASSVMVWPASMRAISSRR